MRRRTEPKTCWTRRGYCRCAGCATSTLGAGARRPRAGTPITRPREAPHDNVGVLESVYRRPQHTAHPAHAPGLPRPADLRLEHAIANLRVAADSLNPALLAGDPSGPFFWLVDEIAQPYGLAGCATAEVPVVAQDADVGLPHSTHQVLVDRIPLAQRLQAKGGDDAFALLTLDFRRLDQTKYPLCSLGGRELENPRILQGGHRLQYHQGVSNRRSPAADARSMNASSAR